MQISYLDGDPNSLGKKTWKPSPQNKSQIQFEVLRSHWSLQRREGLCLIELWPGLQDSSSKGTCCLRLNYADGLITSNTWKIRKLLTQSHGALCGKLLHKPLWEWPRHAEKLWWQEANGKGLGDPFPSIFDEAEDNIRVAGKSQKSAGHPKSTAASFVCFCLKWIDTKSVDTDSPKP